MICNASRRSVSADARFADTGSNVVSDVQELVPRDLQALRDVNRLQEETGVSS